MYRQYCTHTLYTIHPLYVANSYYGISAGGDTVEETSANPDTDTEATPPGMYSTHQVVHTHTV